MAERVGRDHGVPDVIVNSAVPGVWNYIEETSPAEAVSMMQAPYFAAFNTTHAFMADMSQTPVGHHHSYQLAGGLLPPAIDRRLLRGAVRSGACTRCFARTWRVRACGVADVVVGQVDSPYFEHNPGTTAQASHNRQDHPYPRAPTNAVA